MPLSAEIIQAVETIHAAGVATRLMTFTGVLRGSDGRIKIADFAGGSTMRRYTPEFVKRMDDQGKGRYKWTPETLLVNGCKQGLKLARDLIYFEGEYTSTEEC